MKYWRLILKVVEVVRRWRTSNLNPVGLSSLFVFLFTTRWWIKCQSFGYPTVYHHFSYVNQRLLSAPVSVHSQLDHLYSKKIKKEKKKELQLNFFFQRKKKRALWEKAKTTFRARRRPVMKMMMTNEACLEINTWLENSWGRCQLLAYGGECYYHQADWIAR